MRDSNQQLAAAVYKAYGLSPVNSAAILGEFRLPIIEATASLSANLQQLVSLNQNLGISQAVKDMQKLSASLVLPYKQMAALVQPWQAMFAASIGAELQKSVAKSLAISFKFDLPRFYAPPIGLVEPAIEDEVEIVPLVHDGKLEVTVDQFGQFSFGGQRIPRANANTSRHGQLLSMLEGNKGELISKRQIKEHLKVTSSEQVLKDLKKDLRALGFKMDYKPYPRQGIVYKGIIRKQ